MMCKENCANYITWKAKYYDSGYCIVIGKCGFFVEKYNIIVYFSILLFLTMQSKIFYPIHVPIMTFMLSVIVQLRQ